MSTFVWVMAVVFLIEALLQVHSTITQETVTRTRKERAISAVAAFGFSFWAWVMIVAGIA